MATYATIPKDEAEPLVAAAPKAASPKFKAAALALCLASAVAGYQAPTAVKSLFFTAQGGFSPSQTPTASWDVQICLPTKDKKEQKYCLGVPGKGDNGFGDSSDLVLSYYSTPKQGIQKFTLEKYSAPGQKDRYYLRFMSKSGKYNGCAALYGRNGQYSNGGSPIQMQECEWIDNNGGQRQQIIIPGYGASSGTYTGYLDYVLTQKLCIGPPTGKLNNNKGVAVKSDTCNTKYTVKYL